MTGGGSLQDMASSGRAGFAVLTGLFLLCAYGPLAAVAADALGVLAASPAAAGLIIPGGRTLALFLSGLFLAAAVAAAGTVTGWCAATLLWRWTTGPLSLLRWSFLAFALVPPYLWAQAWLEGALLVGRALQVTGIAFSWGWLFSFWVQFASLLPLATGICLAGLVVADTAALEAGRLFGGDMPALLRVVVPVTAPAAGASAALLFLLSVTDYSVPSLFSVNVYALEIFAEYAASGSAGRTLLLALPLMAVTAAVMYLLQGRLRRMVHAADPAAGRLAVPFTFVGWFRGVQALACGVLVTQCAFLTMMLAVGWLAGPRAGGFSAFAAPAAAMSILLSLAAALCALPLAYPLAARMNTDTRGGWWLVALAPLAVPAALVGVGMIALAGPAGLFYGTWALPLAALCARFVPVAALLLLIQMRRVPPLLFDAAAVFEPSPGAGWVRVRLVLLGPGIIAAGMVVFTLAAGELGATLLLLPPGGETVTILMYNYLHYGSSGDVSALGLAMLLLMTGTGIAALWAMGGRGWAGGRPSPRRAPSAGGDLHD